MKRLFFIAGCATLTMLFSPALHLIAQSATFTRIVPTPGESRTESQNFSSNMVISIEIQGKVVQTVNQKQSQQREKEETVLAVSEGVVSKIKVHYAKSKVAQENEMMGTQEMDEPVAGKTYTVESVDGKTVYTTEDGEKPSPQEIQMLGQDYKSFGEVDSMAKFFDGKTLNIGDKVDVPIELAKKIFDAQDDNLNIEEFSFIFEGTEDVDDRRCANFKTILKMRGEAAPGFNLNMDLSGSTLMEIDTCLPIRLNLNGSMGMDGKQSMGAQVMIMKGVGEMTIEMSGQYD